MAENWELGALILLPEVELSPNWRDHENAEVDIRYVDERVRPHCVGFAGFLALIGERDGDPLWQAHTPARDVEVDSDERITWQSFDRSWAVASWSEALDQLEKFLLAKANERTKEQIREKQESVVQRLSLSSPF